MIKADWLLVCPTVDWNLTIESSSQLSSMSFPHPTGDLGTDIGEGHNVLYGEIEHIVVKGAHTHMGVHTGTLTHTNVDPGCCTCSQWRWTGL